MDRHGVRARRHRSPGGDTEFGPAVARGDRAHRARGARRAHFRPPDRHPAPGCETGQHPAGPGRFGPVRAGAADRLRHRAPAGLERATADVHRRNPRHAGLLGAGAGPRRSADTGRRPLLARRDAVHGRRGQGCLRPGRRLRPAHRPAGAADEESGTAIRARGSRAGAGAGAAGTGGGVRARAAVRGRCGSGRRDAAAPAAPAGHSCNARHSRYPCRRYTRDFRDFRGPSVSPRRAAQAPVGRGSGSGRCGAGRGRGRHLGGARRQGRGEGQGEGRSRIVRPAYPVRLLAERFRHRTRRALSLRSGNRADQVLDRGRLPRTARSWRWRWTRCPTRRRTR